MKTKSLLFSVLALSTIHAVSSFAQGPGHGPGRGPGGPDGNIYAQVYTQFFNHYCNGNRVFVDAQSAAQIAQAASQRTSDPNAVYDVFNLTCNWNLATQAGQLSVFRQFDLYTFNSLFGQYCTGNRVVVDAQSAFNIAESAAAGQSNAAVVLSVFQKSCNWNDAVAAGQQTATGQFDDSAYNLLFGQYCTGNRVVVDSTSAMSVAEDSARRSSNAYVVLDVFQRSCVWNDAVQAGRYSAQGQFRQEIYDQFMGRYCSGNRVVIDSTSALQVANRAAIGTINPQIVLQVFTSSCDWNAAMQAGSGGPAPRPPVPFPQPRPPVPRPPMPFPGPQPHPGPQPVPHGCQVHSGGMVNGVQMFTVVTLSGVPIASVSTQQEADHIAQSDVRCQ